MTLEPTAYGPDVESLLALDGSGGRLMPLSHGRCSSDDARRELARKSPLVLFPESRAPAAAFSGMWLYFSCLDESHQVSQAIDTPDGSFWHGIMHRQEPDAGNAAYWFKRVGSHAIFPALLETASELARYRPEVRIRLGDKWDPFAFIDFCEQAREQPGSSAEMLAMEIQRAEWQLLFDSCARKRT
jgi:hypothetical protein